MATFSLESSVYYKGFTRMLYMERNKVPHDSSPIHINYIRSNICQLYKIRDGEIRKESGAEK
jgi:hypothetical protein